MSEVRRNVARIIESTAARLMMSSEDSEIDQLFAVAEEQCREILNGQEGMTFVKKRIAEWKLRLRCDANMGVAEIDSTLRELESLGYENVDTEYSLGIYVIDYWIRNEHFHKAESMLNKLAKLILDSDLQPRTLNAWRDEIQVRMSSIPSS